jgi:hypothetical protein
MVHYDEGVCTLGGLMYDAQLHGLIEVGPLWDVVGTVDWVLLYNNVEARYVLSWLLHFSRTGVRLERIEAETSQGRSDAPPPARWRFIPTRNPASTDAVLRCWQERSGEWHRKATQQLAQQYHRPPEQNTGQPTVETVLLHLSRTYSLSFVLDPQLTYGHLRKLMKEIRKIHHPQRHRCPRPKGAI